VRRNWLARLLLLAAAFSLIWGVTRGALWDPYEVSVAELARRIAVHLLGGKALLLAGADNSLPIRADLGRGELPFTSAALGFRLFGLSEWAGRLPLALWSVLGLGAVHAALARLWDRKAALYAVLILATTPLYFLQARTLLGDAVTLSTFAIAWSGLSLALLAPGLSGRSRWGFGLLGAFGLYAGFWCRGAIVSVAVPALAVALPALLVRPVPGRALRSFSWALGLLGLGALGAGLAALWLAQQSGEYSVWVGSALAAPAELPTFQLGLEQLAHAAFPWSAAAPLALALAWPGGAPRGASEQAVTSSATLSLGLGLAASAWLSPALGAQVLPGLCGFAILVACALREVEDGSLGSPVLGLCVAALALILGFDLRTFPEKALAGFGIAGLMLPESLQALSAKLWTWSALGLALGVVICLYEREPARARAASFERAEYEAVLASLQRVWDGNLVFGLLVLEAALVGFLLLSAVSERLIRLPQLDAFGDFSRKLAAYSAVAVPLAALVPLGAMLLRDLSRALFGGRWLGRRAAWAPTRAQGVLLLGLGVGLAGSFGFYPALAAQVSPKQVFERYRELSRPGDELGMLGEASAAARYQGGASVERFEEPDSAFAWLSGSGRSRASRRFLVLRRAELAQLNARFREQNAQNLPIVDARSSEVLLAVNRRAPAEHDENPLAALLLARAPVPQHPLHAAFSDKLEVLGWSLQSLAGEPELSIVPATRYRFIIYFRVLGPVSGGWQTFVHIDGFQRRFNADHELLEGKYPLSLWRAGDLIADTTELVLEPNFSPGNYHVFFGLYSGSHRLEVTEGPAEGDRIEAGTLQVR
jgi:4-amino-4-deoxy-L-arabinose transferase-like glycosyltransferase